MNPKKYFLALLMPCFWGGQTVWAQTSVTNVRLSTSHTVRKVIVEYELPQVLPGDSIYLELQTAAGRIIRPISVNGDVGTALKPGLNKLIAWDVVRDNVRLNEDVTVLLRVASTIAVASPAAVKPPVTSPATAQTLALKPTTDRVAEPGSVVRSKLPMPLIGGGVAVGLAGYATVLALGINKDVDAYNAKPYADNSADLQQFKDQKSTIDSKKGTFMIVAGAAVVVGVATGIYTLIRNQKAARSGTALKPPRMSLLVNAGPPAGGLHLLGSRVVSLGLSRNF